MKTVFKMTLIIIFSLSLSSCLLPEKFESTVEVKASDEYKAEFSGTMVFAPAQVELVNGGKLTQSFEAELKEFSKEILKDKVFKSAEYIGNAKYQITASDEGKLIETVAFLPGDLCFITITPLPNNQVEIKGIELGPNDIKELISLGINLDGTFHLKTKGKVIKNNATSKPKFGMFGGYTWKIKSYEDPSIYALIQF